MNHLLRWLFFACFVNPFILIVIGLNVRRRNNLPRNGPAIVVANHNSHLDALTLISLFGLKRLRKVRPVAAADYFMKKGWLAWFATKIIGIVPISKTPKREGNGPFAKIYNCIENDEILLFFPEGTRGEPEVMEDFKSGIAHIAKKFPDVPVVPVFVHGLGKSLPKGEGLLVPFFCDIFIGENFHWTGNRESFMEELNSRMAALHDEGDFPEWE